MMKKNLVVLTMNFPYGLGESFIENEIPHYNHFDKVLFIPMQLVGTIRNLNFPENISIHKVNPISKTSKILFLLSVLLKISFWKEFILIFKQVSFISSKIKKLISFQTHSEWYASQVLKILHKEHINPRRNIIFYSYWMMHQAYVAAKLNKREVLSITRCHRWDMYEYLNIDDYLPLRKYLIKGLSKIYSISSDGKKYLDSRYDTKDKIVISRLGTNDYGFRNFNEGNDNVIKIVTCSWLVPVKRIDKLVNALTKITNINLHWTHLGDGPLYQNINDSTKNLPANIKTHLPGKLSYQEIINYYSSNSPHVFINVSESEGVPVSIMEALSFGIPVIATNVGGVSEIIVDGFNGYLLNENFKAEELIARIMNFKTMSTDNYTKLKNNARISWQNNYSSNQNYTKFFNELINE